MESLSSMQNEGNVQCKCNVGSPFSKAVIQGVMMKCMLCIRIEIMWKVGCDW